MRVEEALRSIGVADAAAELRRLLAAGRPEDAMAFRTGDPARIPRRVVSANRNIVPVGRRFPAHGGSLLSIFVSTAGVSRDQSRDLGHRRDVLRVRDLIALRGICGKSASSGSCTMAVPPSWRITRKPTLPSSNVPERTTPITRSW